MIRIPEPLYPDTPHPLYAKWGEAGALLQRNSSKLIVSSDVINRQDLDAELTTEACTGVAQAYEFYPLVDPNEAPYHADMIVTARDLAIATTAHDIERANRQGCSPLEQVMLDRKMLINTCLDGLVNCAPRSQELQGANGRDFVLAVFASGVRLYGTPDTLFEYVAKHPDLMAVYKVPTEKHPAFREGEQFRSARVARSHRFPDHLVPVANREFDRDFQTKIKQFFPHERLRPHVAFLDKYENTRLRAPRLLSVLERLRALRDAEGYVGIHIDGIQWIIRAKVATSLDRAKRGEFSIYLNPAEDVPESQEQGGYLELVRKVDDPNNQSYKEPQDLRSGTILSVLSSRSLELSDRRWKIQAGTKVDIVKSDGALSGNELAEKACNKVRELSSIR